MYEFSSGRTVSFALESTRLCDITDFWLVLLPECALSFFVCFERKTRSSPELFTVFSKNAICELGKRAKSIFTHNTTHLHKLHQFTLLLLYSQIDLHYTVKMLRVSKKSSQKPKKCTKMLALAIKRIDTVSMGSFSLAFFHIKTSYSNRMFICNTLDQMFRNSLRFFHENMLIRFQNYCGRI